MWHQKIRLHRLPLRGLTAAVPRGQCRLLVTTTNNTQKPYYITTPIFYPNAVPHIGHLHSLLVADIFARFQRLRNPETPVHFLAGTDEHGLKIQKAALAKGLAPNLFCDQSSAQFRKLGEKAQISNTHFMRTTQEAHHRTVEHVWRELDAKGLIYKGKYSGWYSITDECFYTTAQIGPSPTNPDVMVSLETGAVVEWADEENYMFRLSAFQPTLYAYYSRPENSRTIFPPQHHAHILQILSEPLEDLSISRPRSRLEWGVGVPGDPNQTVYVWFDALLVYLSGIGYPWKDGGNGQAQGWPVNLQVIGKDILRFHAIYLPAILQALDLPLQQQLLAHAHWTVEQKKMSKSLGNVADPFDAMETFGVDIVRYYLARVGGRFRDDVDWSQEQLEKHNKELQSLLGNFLLRIASSKIQARIASYPHSPSNTNSILPSPSIQALLASTYALPQSLDTSLSDLEISDALNHIVDLLRVANKTITEVAPWKESCPPEEVYKCYGASVEALRVAGICLQPFVPGVAVRLLDALGVGRGERGWRDLDMGGGGMSGKAVGGKAVEAVRLF